MKKLKVLSLFSGIGAFEEALNNIGVDFDLVNYCEFNPTVAKAYSIIHNVSEDLNLGDITKVDETQLDDFDLMTYGFPCQDISSLGNQKGLFNEEGNLTRSGLFFEAMRIVKHKKPKYLIAENVRALVSKKMINDFSQMLDLLDELGYNSYYQVLNSKDYTIPHSRNRVFIISIRKDVDNNTFKFPEKQPLTLKASDFYDTQIDDVYYVEEKHHKYFNEFRLKKKYSSLNSDVLICMTTKQGQRSNPQNFVQDDKGYRILTVGEMLALQGFNRDYGQLLLQNGISIQQVGFMCGNSITVTVLEYIFRNLFNI